MRDDVSTYPVMVPAGMELRHDAQRLVFRNASEIPLGADVLVGGGQTSAGAFSQLGVVDPGQCLGTGTVLLLLPG